MHAHMLVCCRGLCQPAFKLRCPAPTSPHACAHSPHSRRMFKAVPCFCHSHLMSLMTIAATNTVPNQPKFDASLAPPVPMHMDKILSPADVDTAYDMVANVVCMAHSDNRQPASTLNV